MIPSHTSKAADHVLSSMEAELENGRMARLLIKLGMICERADDAMDTWAETGDRYLVKLFRDFVLHQARRCI